MEKNELKSGMVVEIRKGHKMLLVGDELIGNGGYSPLSEYNDNLKNIVRSDFDIIKVYNFIYMVFNRLLEDDNLDLIWERKEIKLADKEIEILKALKLLDFNFLARDRNNCLYAYSSKPHKETHMDWSTDDGEYIRINSDIFDFIKWEDEEPTKNNIQ